MGWGKNVGGLRLQDGAAHPLHSLLKVSRRLVVWLLGTEEPLRVSKLFGR